MATTVPPTPGPSGIGKSTAALDVARTLGGEIVVCDSGQVNVRLDIATNEPSREDMRRPCGAQPGTGGVDQGIDAHSL